MYITANLKGEEGSVRAKSSVTRCLCNAAKSIRDINQEVSFSFFLFLYLQFGL